MQNASSASVGRERSHPTTPTVPAIKRLNKDKVRRFLMGSKEQMGFVQQFSVYALLICIGFIYIYPVLYMVSCSFMSLDDLLDSSIKWLPSSFNISNYIQAAKSMSYGTSLWKSIVLAGVPTLCNLASCSIIGYGLARYDFPGKKIIFGIIIVSFVLPSQVTMIPTYVLYNKLGILEKVWAFVLPALLGQGFNAPIFILIFWQFFRQIPKVLIEASRIDGAGHFKTFVQVALPSAAPAFVTVSLFSFVWYWNESYLTELYVKGVFGGSDWTNLVLQLSAFATNYSEYANTAASGATSLNESISMAGTVLSILPLMLLYFVLQRQFVESIDKAGITGE